MKLYNMICSNLCGEFMQAGYIGKYYAEGLVFSYKKGLNN